MLGVSSSTKLAQDECLQQLELMSHAIDALTISGRLGQRHKFKKNRRNEKRRSHIFGKKGTWKDPARIYEPAVPTAAAPPEDF
jgi:hypothetical protein